MPRSFDLSADYETGVEQVYSTFADERYWAARLASSGADEAAVESMHVDGDGIDVSTVQVLRSDRLPGIVTQLHRGDLRIERRERWGPVAGGRSSATISGAIPGAPVSVTGDGVLRPADGGPGSRIEIRVSVGVRIPLVGGKVESFIGSQLVDLLIAEQRFTTEWIAQNPHSP